MEASVLSGQRPEQVALAWSGGKDSALALRAFRREGIEVAALLTTVTESYERVSMHGVRRGLVVMQAAAAGVPLVEVRIPPECPNAVYEERMAQALATPPLDRIETIAFGDLFLVDVRTYREERLAACGKRGLFPLWGEDTAALARAFVAGGFAARVVCVDPQRLEPAFAGRAFDEAFLTDLPPEVDPCGENGEFHTFVHAGPVLAHPVGCTVGKRIERDGFVFCDLLPA
jgi:uncharacterized protein (TIGR00290 family)